MDENNEKEFDEFAPLYDPEFGPDLVELTDEEGVSHCFELLHTLELEDGRKYVALVPHYDDDSLGKPGELVILRAQQEDGEEFLVGIESDDEFEEISALFIKELEDFYEITE